VTLGILGKKIGMTQIFDQKGNVIPVTIIKSEPCIVTQIKLENKCGYNAIQIGYEELRPNHKTFEFLIFPTTKLDKNLVSKCLK